MFDAGLTLTSLRDCLAHIEPVQLLGMELLKQHSAHSQGHWFPIDIPRNQMVNAVTELVDYTRRCAYAAVQISHLTSVPLTSVPILEFGL
ncbi:MAG: hypothetical protein LCI00_15515 [Chloroflexi bacterium]|nr:hypothetical protein [Chloroflexota bacterium]